MIEGIATEPDLTCYRKHMGVRDRTRHKDVAWMAPKPESTWRNGLVVLKSGSTCVGMLSAMKEVISDVELLGRRRHVKDVFYGK